MRPSSSSAAPTSGTFGICWATSIGLGVYIAGHAFEKVLGVGGLVAAGAVGGALIGVFVWKRMRARRSAEPGGDDGRLPERDPAVVRRQPLGD